MFASDEFYYFTRVKNGKKYLKAYLLEAKKHSPIIENFLVMMNNFVNDRVTRGEFKKKFKYKMLSKKLQNAFLKTSKKFYDFVPLSLEDVLASEELETLMQRGLKDVNLLKKWLYDFLNEKHDGFLPASRRMEILEEISKELNVDAGKILIILESSMEKNHVLRLINNTSPTIQEFIDEFNKHALETILYHSKQAIIYFKNLKGRELKKLVFWTKGSGLSYWVEKESETTWSFLLEGPSEFSRMTRFDGKKILFILKRAIEHGLNIEKVLLKLKISQETLNAELPPALLNLIKKEDFEIPAMDSEVENKFMSAFKGNLHGWEIEAEGEPLVKNNVVFIPDFVLKRGSNKFYLEIVGFWTPEYLSKKINKLKIFFQEHDNILLLVDKKHAHLFENTGWPCFYYSSERDIPYSEIYSYINKKTKRDLEKTIKTALKLIQNLSTSKNLIRFNEISSRLGISTSLLEKELVKLDSRGTIKDLDLKIIKGVGLIKEDYLDMILQQVKAKLGKKFTRDDLRKITFKDLTADDLERVLSSSNKISKNWKSLTELEYQVID